MKVRCKRCKSEYESPIPLPDGECESCPNCAWMDKLNSDLEKFFKTE